MKRLASFKHKGYFILQIVTYPLDKVIWSLNNRVLNSRYSPQILNLLAKTFHIIHFKYLDEKFR